MHKGSTSNNDEDLLYPTKFLNSLLFSSLPDHTFALGFRIPIILLRNLNQSTSLYSGTKTDHYITRQPASLKKIILDSSVGDVILIS